MSRRTQLVAALAVGIILAPFATNAQQSAKAESRPWEPGSATGAHQHPGPAILHVLEGELEETREGTALTLKAGQTVWNRGKIPHDVVNRADGPARALAIHLDPGR